MTAPSWTSFLDTLSATLERTDVPGAEVQALMDEAAGWIFGVETRREQERRAAQLAAVLPPDVRAVFGAMLGPALGAPSELAKVLDAAPPDDRQRLMQWVERGAAVADDYARRAGELRRGRGGLG